MRVKTEGYFKFKLKIVVQAETTLLKSIIAEVIVMKTESLIREYSGALEFAEDRSITQQNIICVLFHRSESLAQNFIKSVRKSHAYAVTKHGNPLKT